jgi:hypothetical protein
MIVVRWLVITILAAATTVGYSLALSGVAAGLFPDSVRSFHDLFESESVWKASLQSGLEWGVFAALVMGPCLGFTLIRDYNAFLDHPGKSGRFWRSIIRSLALSFAIIAISAFALCGLTAAAIALQGGSSDQVKHRAFLSLVFGHLAVGTIVGLGHFFRNPPDLHLGSSDDARITRGGPAHRP